MTKVQLPYSTEPKRGTKRVILSSLLIAVGLIGLLIVAQFLEPLVRWRIPFLKQQQVCMHWIGPAGKIAYTEDSAEAQRLSGGS